MPQDVPITPSDGSRDRRAVAEPPAFNLLRYFLVVGLVANAVILVLAATQLPGRAQREIVQLTAETGAQLGAGIASGLFSRAKGESLPGQEASLSDLVSGPEFAQRLRSAVASTMIVRVKIWDRSGEVVYATDEVSVGTSNPANPGLRAALEGQTYSKVEEFKPGEAAGEEALSDIVEVYVPIIDEDPGGGETIQDAFEVYLPVDLELQRRVSAVMGTVIRGALAALSLQFLVLLLVVYRGHRAIRSSRDQLIQAQRQAREAERSMAIVGLARRFAHEVLNPLGALTNAVFLHRSFLEERGIQPARGLRSIEREAARINRLVRDLLAYTERARPRWQEVELGSLLEDILGELILPANIGVVREMEREVNLVADPDYLRQAAESVLQNATEAMPQGGTLSVRIGADEREGVIEVRDTGGGIAAEHLPHIFEALFTTKTGGGFGLGLAAAKALIEAHGGRIEVGSQVGRGSTFTIRLPRSPSTEAGP